MRPGYGRAESAKQRRNGAAWQTIHELEAAMGSFAILDLTSPWFWIAAVTVLLLLVALVLKFFVFR